MYQQPVVTTNADGTQSVAITQTVVQDQSTIQAQAAAQVAAVTVAAATNADYIPNYNEALAHGYSSVSDYITAGVGSYAATQPATNLQTTPSLANTASAGAQSLAHFIYTHRLGIGLGIAALAGGAYLAGRGKKKTTTILQQPLPYNIRYTSKRHRFRQPQTQIGRRIRGNTYISNFYQKGIPGTTYTGQGVTLSSPTPQTTTVGIVSKHLVKYLPGATKVQLQNPGLLTNAVSGLETGVGFELLTKVLIPLVARLAPGIIALAP